MPSIDDTRAEVARLLSFSAVGGTGAVVNVGLLLLFTHFGIPLAFSTALAIEGSVLWNFVLNDLWTFRHIRGNSSWLRRCVKYHLIMSIGVSLNYAAVLVLAYHLHIIIPIAGVLGVGLGMIWNYGANRLLNYRGPHSLSRIA